MAEMWAVRVLMKRPLHGVMYKSHQVSIALREVARREQVAQLRSAGLIQGGALDNALVCDGHQWLNPPLRFADEPVRHKILDLIGDLALVGLPCAQVMAFRGSHSLHTQLAAALAAATSCLTALSGGQELTNVA